MAEEAQDRGRIVVEKPIVAIGRMSGTSADGTDAALLRTDGAERIEFVGGLTLEYDDELRSRLLEASQHDVPVNALLRLERDVTEHHAKAIELLR